MTCRSPWNPAHQNGVAIAGLLTHLAEAVPAPAPMLAAHITIDILRPTPFGPIVGRALAFLMELRLDEGPLGEEEARRRLQAWWDERTKPA